MTEATATRQGMGRGRGLHPWGLHPWGPPGCFSPPCCPSGQPSRVQPVGLLDLAFSARFRKKTVKRCWEFLLGGMVPLLHHHPLPCALQHPYSRCTPSLQEQPLSQRSSTWLGSRVTSPQPSPSWPSWGAGWGGAGRNEWKIVPALPRNCWEQCRLGREGKGLLPRSMLGKAMGGGRGHSAWGDKILLPPLQFPSAHLHPDWILRASPVL